eukprot:11482128-Ditylum_brightwellii.AAC.1
MSKHNLKFANQKDYNGNTLRNVCTQERNATVKNKNWALKTYTGMFIDLTCPKDDGIPDQQKATWLP